MKPKLLISTLLICVFSCDLFEYSHYQVAPHKGYNNINQQNISRFINTEADTLKIALISDTQRYYKSSEKVISQINNIPGIDFVIHAGDLVDFGLQREFTLTHELLSELNYPYVAVVGNHDLIGNGGEIYNHMYGEYDFSFTFLGYKFVFLNTNSREFGFDGSVPDISWLDRELSDTSKYSRAIVVNHVPPFNEDFYPGSEDSYVDAIRRYGKVMLCINGHTHDFDFSEPYNDGIPYLSSFSTTHEKFVLLKIWDNVFSFEIIGFNENKK
jgi:Icc protein